MVWVVIAVLVVALLGTGIFIYMQHKEMSDFKEQVEIDKQRSELEKEYSDLAAQYDQFEGQKMMFNNDSLIEKLDAEKVKVQRLLEELRTVKNTSSARIEELKRELTTLRGIMRHYVMQIDSLNVANKQLREENAKVTRRYREVAQTASQLKPRIVPSEYPKEQVKEQQRSVELPTADMRQLVREARRTLRDAN